MLTGRNWAEAAAMQTSSRMTTFMMTILRPWRDFGKKRWPWRVAIRKGSPKCCGFILVRPERQISPLTSAYSPWPAHASTSNKCTPLCKNECFVDKARLFWAWFPGFCFELNRKTTRDWAHQDWGNVTERGLFKSLRCPAAADVHEVFFLGTDVTLDCTADSPSVTSFQLCFYFCRREISQAKQKLTPHCVKMCIYDHTHFGKAVYCCAQLRFFTQSVHMYTKIWGSSSSFLWHSP